MASFFLFADTDTQQVLTGDETGFLGEGVNLAVSNATNSAILATGGAHDIVILGSVFAVGSYAITQSGTIFDMVVGQNGTVVGGGAYGVYSDFSSSFTMDNAGYVTADTYGVWAGVNDGVGFTQLSNSGTISAAGGTAVYLISAGVSAEVTNSGVIQGLTGIEIDGSVDLSNTGTIAADPAGVALSAAGSLNSLFNAGTIVGDVNILSTVETLFANSGEILGDTTFGVGLDRVENLGEMQGIDFAGGIGALANFGTISGDVIGSDDDDDFMNAGSMQNVDLADGVNRFENVGGLVGRLDGGAFSDVIENSGTIDRVDLGASFDRLVNLDGTIGEVHTGDDDDVVINGGTIGEIYLGEGADRYQGRAGQSDVVNGQAGDDTIIGGDYGDSLSGGDDRDLIRGRANDDEIDAGTGNDTVYGGSGDDEIAGGAGRDTLEGQGGDDTIQGDGGKDLITGGKGDDCLIGGADRDVFVFAVSDGADEIKDFTVGEDKIDLSAFGLQGYGPSIQPQVIDLSDGCVIDFSVQFGLRIYLDGVFEADLGLTDFIL